jgi:hypothetical protein
MVEEIRLENSREVTLVYSKTLLERFVASFHQFVCMVNNKKKIGPNLSVNKLL